MAAFSYKNHDAIVILHIAGSAEGKPSERTILVQQSLWSLKITLPEIPTAAGCPEVYRKSAHKSFHSIVIASRCNRQSDIIMLHAFRFPPPQPKPGTPLETMHTSNLIRQEVVRSVGGHLPKRRQQGRRNGRQTGHVHVVRYATLGRGGGTVRDSAKDGRDALLQVQTAEAIAAEDLHWRPGRSRAIPVRIQQHRGYPDGVQQH